MCLGGPKASSPVPFTPTPAPEAPPPPSASASTVKQADATNPFLAKPKPKKNPLRIDRNPGTDSGAQDSVATGLNIPV